VTAAGGGAGRVALTTPVRQRPAGRHCHHHAGDRGGCL